MADEKDLGDPKMIQWRTHVSKRVEQFSRVLDEEQSSDTRFAESFVARLAARCDALAQINFKLSFTYLALMASLFLYQNSTATEFEILGYGFKNIDPYKELLLIVAATTLPISASIWAYQKYLSALAKECIGKLVTNEDSRKFYSLSFFDDRYAWIANHDREDSKSWHGFTISLLMIFLFMLVSLICTLYAGSIFVQTSVIFEILSMPSDKVFFKYFLITYTVGCVLLSWLIYALQLPLPEVDYSYHERLTEMKKQDPDRYRKFIHNRARIDFKKENYSLVFLNTVVHISVYSGIGWYFFSHIAARTYLFMFNGMLGAIIVSLVSYAIFQFVREAVHKIHFMKYRDDSSEGIKVFVRNQRGLLLIKIFVPVVVSAIYSARELYNLAHI